MTKICANKLCGKEFTPTPCRTPHRQKYCPACVSLSVSVRRRTEPPKQQKCDNPECPVGTFTPRSNLTDRQRYCSNKTAGCTMSAWKGRRTVESPSRPNAPGAGQSHKAKIFWTGKDKLPPVFCVSCNAYRASETFCGTMVDYVQMGSFL